MTLPLFEDPPAAAAPSTPGRTAEEKRRCPKLQAYRLGAIAGRSGQPAHYHDDDPEVVRYWMDGYRFGQLLRPVKLTR